MPIIRSTTQLNAPISRVFDLARSIDAHIESASQTNERAIAGRTSGLIEHYETVTWEAKHFGIRQQLTGQITEFDRPNMFTDEMLSGAFKQLRHVHRFRAISEAQTQMDDELHILAPLGLLGRLAEVTFLNAYMKRFLEGRNQILKEIAESDRWMQYLQDDIPLI
ncbi:MAG: cell division protein [Phycisphaerales bacterium]